MKNGTKAKRPKPDAPAAQRVRFVRGDQFVEVTLEYAREGKFVTGHSPELGTSAFGAGRNEAASALIEAIALQLEALEDAGELVRFLKDRGVELQTEQRKHWTPVNPNLVPA